MMFFCFVWFDLVWLDGRHVIITFVSHCLTAIQALELISEMDEVGVVPTEECFSFAIAACAEVGRWREACDAIKVMRCVYSAAMYCTVHTRLDIPMKPH